MSARPAWGLWLALALVAGCGDDGGGPSDAGGGVDAATTDGGGSTTDDGGSSTDDGGSATDDGGTAPGDSGSASVDPSAPGPYPVTSTITADVMRSGRTTPVVAHVPTLPAGTRAPLVVFFPGFQLESVRYAATCDHVASHGFVVVRADPPASLFSADHVAMAADGRAVIDWALGASSPIASVVDGEQVGTMGHSLGGKIATMIAFADSRVDALLGIDPVNGGAGPSGYSATTPDIVPDQVTPLTIPVGFLGETTNATGGFMPCAPADQNFQTFYAAATSAPWAAQFDFTGADHMDFIDDTAGCGFTCSACTAGTADAATVVAATHTLAAAFFLRHLRAVAPAEAYLTGASVPAGVVVMHR